jgi:hypothetical protein
MAGNQTYAKLATSNYVLELDLHLDWLILR